MQDYKTGESPAPQLFVSIEIDNQSYPSREFQYIGMVNVPSDIPIVVFKMKTTGQCLLLPNLSGTGLMPLYAGSKLWEEKNCTDLRKKLEYFQNLNFLIQDFRFATVMLHAADHSRSLTIIIADDFELVCKKKPLYIHNRRECKGNEEFKNFGNCNFVSILEDSQNQDYVHQMFEVLIKEYAIAYIFNLRFSPTCHDFDPLAIAFERDGQKELNLQRATEEALPSQFPSELIAIISSYNEKIPRARYMVWDLVNCREGQTRGCSYLSQYSFKLLQTFTQEDFKKFKEQLGVLSEIVARAITFFSFVEDEPPALRQIGLENFQKLLTNNFEKALNDDIYLKNALQYAVDKAKAVTGHECIIQLKFLLAPQDVIHVEGLEEQKGVFSVPMPQQVSAAPLQTSALVALSLNKKPRSEELHNRMLLEIQMLYTTELQYSNSDPTFLKFYTKLLQAMSKKNYQDVYDLARHNGKQELIDIVTKYQKMMNFTLHMPTCSLM